MSEEKKLELFQYRVGLLLGSIAYPFFGWFSEAFLFVNFDSLTSRLPVATFSLVSILLTYKLKFVRMNFRYFVIVASCWAMHQYILLFVQSNYHFYFAIGLTAMPFIIFTILFHPIDIVIFFSYTLAVGAIVLKNSNIVFITTYLVLIFLAFTVYLLVTRNRLFLLKRLRDNLEQIKQKQAQIDEKNRSLVRIGEIAAQVAHDIRSPVTALEALSEMLGNEIDPKKKRLIENAAKRINDIANNLVTEYRTNLTRDLSTATFDRHTNLNTLIENIIEEKKLLLDRHHSILFTSPESVDTPGSLNEVDFQRVISNLINNSIESLDKETGLIEVSLIKKEKIIQIVIRDNGSGIPAERLNKIFEKGSSTKSKGAGLGLSHAKTFIESIGGTLSIKSTPKEQTEVVVTLK